MTDNARWTTRGTFTRYTSEVADLAGQPAFFPASSGFGNLGRTYIEEGKSITQLVGFTWNPVDSTQSASLVTLGNTAPDFRIGFVNDVTYGALAFGAVLDWQHGGNVINLTQYLYDSAGNSEDFGSPEWDLRRRFRSNGSIEPYIEDASFVKLREASIGAQLPSSLFSGLLPAESVRISVSGRNLWMWKKYTGLDPEVANFGPAAVRNNLDIAPYPPSRSFFFNISVGF
jgi:hypothetical protein